ncbi:MAG TPA: N-acyl homoserine lactonase family protein [Xanthobacteraceae bacterium]|nr:N-acyl homoserine lactonase family protein [Xanthobacteraceae bacterium]
MRPDTDRPTHRMSRRTSISSAITVMGLLLGLGAVALLNADIAALAQAQPASPKLYVFDVGSLKSRDPKPLLDRGVTITDMSVTAYLIVHPRGTLLWDSGTIPDELVKPGGTTVERATVHKTLSGQLAEIGYKPGDINYLALSHYHYDHSANANQYSGSTWLVQAPERAAMFPDTPPANPIDPNVAAKFSALKNAKTTILNGDHDVFGDGSVVIISTPGHTPGHQSLYVRLAKSGPLVLSGDLYHYPSERTLKDFLPFGGRGNDAQEAASKAKVEALLKDKGATFWIQHDILADAKLKKSPAFYD